MRMLKTAVAIAALMLTGAAHAQDKVIMRINFTPWAMHAQYFGGVAQGIYKAEGIDLEIRPPSAGQQNEVFIGTAFFNLMAWLEQRISWRTGINDSTSQA